MGLISFIRKLAQIRAQRPDIPGSYREDPLVRTILNRRSVRKFLDCDIKDEEMTLILEAARLAPSTVNMQTWSFGVYNTETWRETFGRSIPFGARRAVLVLGDITRIKQATDIFPNSPLVEYTVSIVNASLAAMNMTIMAQALGIASVMLSDTGKTGFFSTAYLKERLKLPAGVYPLMTIVFGYPKARNVPMPPKFNIEDITFSGTYRQTHVAKIHEWFSLMEAGYRASTFFSSFRAKLSYYRQNLSRSERELRDIVLGEKPKM
ncbi:MAG: nitroreductase family protein [Deltaproteobacteria bacterium]|nr:nitroreductase family protein [Deltaproteobacteria bacterium]MBW2074926.1 nitroreductase family protein [Deltaproteobacteria bacterium]